MEKVKSEPYGPIIIMNFKVRKINLFILKSLSLSLFFIFFYFIEKKEKGKKKFAEVKIDEIERRGPKGQK